MLDIRLIREKPDFVRDRLATRGGGDEVKIDEVLRIDVERRKAQTELQRLQSERNRLSKEIGARRSRKDPSEELVIRNSGRLASKLPVSPSVRTRSTTHSAICFWKFQIFRMRAFHLVRTRAQIELCAVGARNRNWPTPQIT